MIRSIVPLSAIFATLLRSLNAAERSLGKVALGILVKDPGPWPRLCLPVAVIGGLR